MFQVEPEEPHNDNVFAVAAASVCVGVIVGAAVVLGAAWFAAWGAAARIGRMF